MKGVVDSYHIVLPPKQGTSQLISGPTGLYVCHFYPNFFPSQITDAAPLPPSPHHPKMIIRGDSAVTEASCENNVK